MAHLINDVKNAVFGKHEGYGDVHLHHSDYSSECPKACGTKVNYEHANLCGSVPFGSAVPGVQYRNGQEYDCGCNLCSAPYSVPYASGKGGHLGDMLQFKPCKNPYCRCPDCDGNCKCGMKEGFGNMGESCMGNFLLLLIIAAFVYYFFFYKQSAY